MVEYVAIGGVRSSVLCGEGAVSHWIALRTSYKRRKTKAHKGHCTQERLTSGSRNRSSCHVYHVHWKACKLKPITYSKPSTSWSTVCRHSATKRHPYNPERKRTLQPFLDFTSLLVTWCFSSSEHGSSIVDKISHYCPHLNFMFEETSNMGVPSFEYAVKFIALSLDF